MYDYRNYWLGEYEKRQKEKYYERLYGSYIEFYKFSDKDNILT